MLQVYKYDSNGNYIEPVSIDVDENGKYVLPENCTDLPLPQPNWKPLFQNGNWVETITQDELDILTGQSLDQLKQNKLNELNEACNQSILGKFTADVDGVTYSFSHDDAAQSNFKDAKLSWIDGDLALTDVLPWTAYNANGDVVRLQLNKEKFDPVYKAHVMVAMNNVSKLRDTLQPQVESSTTKAQLDAIVW